MESLMSGFRLLSARTLEHVERRPWRPGFRSPPSRPIKLAFGEPNTELHSGSDNRISVILGKNGQGKSRALSAIAISFQLLQRFRSAGSKRSLPVSRLEYLMDGRHHLITCEASDIRLEIDGHPKPLDLARLPSRVVGLSMTPFDKFPIGNEPRQLHLFEPDQPDIYAYLGMRERMGRASSTALLNRAVEGMFARIGLDDRGRITHVFDMLGFKPRLTIVYRLEHSDALRQLAGGGDPPNVITLGARASYNSYNLDRLQRILNEGGEPVERLRTAAQTAISLSDRNYVSVELDLREPDSASFQVHEHLQEIRRAGMARLFAVEAPRSDGTIIDLKEASSGELSMAITFMSLAANLKDDALILIDEPETNLHPEWQAQYLDLLLGTFKEYRGCHYILATHSPLILSDAPPSATVSSLSHSNLHDGEGVSGRPVDYLLVKAFDVASGSNYYVQEELIRALRLAADGCVSQAEFKDSVNELTQIKPLIKDSPGVVKLIEDLCQIAAKSRPE